MSKCRASRLQDLENREYDSEGKDGLSVKEQWELEWLRLLDGIDDFRFDYFWPIIRRWREWRLNRDLR